MTNNSHPTSLDNSKMFGINFEKTIVDKMMLEEELEYTLKDKGITLQTDKGNILN